MANEMLRSSDIDAAVREAREAYAARHPRSHAVHLRATSVMPGGNTRSVLHYGPFPLVMSRAEGCRMWDLDGVAYVDFLADYSAGLYGHSHPEIRAALERVLDGGIGFGATNSIESEFAAAVCQRFGFERVRFTNSGTEANLLALAAARVFTRRHKVLAFPGSYHGSLLAFAGGSSPLNAPFDWVMGRYNDVDATRAAIRSQTEQLAAVIVEPMIGSGGCIPATIEFLEMLRAETHRVGALLIFDEVMTSRLAPGGLQSLMRIAPDLTTLGKYVGGGMSCGAFGGTAKVLDLFDPRRADALVHAGTFNNNVLTMSAGLAGLTRVFRPDVAIALNARGDALRGRLNELSRRVDAPLQFTGLGSMLAVHTLRGHIASPEVALQADAGLKELFFFDLLARGIWLARRGMMSLSLPIGDGECEALERAVEQFVSDRRSLFM